MCSAPKIPKPPKPDPEPQPVDEVVVEEMKDRRRKARLRSGIAGTLLTGGSGLSDEPPSRKATLLGGP